MDFEDRDEMGSAATYSTAETEPTEWSDPNQDEQAQTPAPSPQEMGEFEAEATTSAAEPLIGDLDVLGRFYADLAKTPLLDREAERSLTKEISRAREAVVRWLRRNPRIQWFDVSQTGWKEAVISSVRKFLDQTEPNPKSTSAGVNQEPFPS